MITTIIFSLTGIGVLISNGIGSTAKIQSVKHEVTACVYPIPAITPAGAQCSSILFNAYPIRSVGTPHSNILNKRYAIPNTIDMATAAYTTNRSHINFTSRRKKKASEILKVTMVTM